ncbi:regulation of ruffle assembly protein [Malassezia pachydermatis]
MESFYPTDLGQEIVKCARILRTFTENNQVAAVENEQRGHTHMPAPSATGSVPDDYADRKTQSVLYKIPPKVLQQAKGVAIFTVFRSGFVVSGAGGSGVVLTKDENGQWGSPSGILIHTVGWGLMIGMDIYDVVLILRDDRAVNAFKYPKISVGGELTVSAGPVGNGAMLDTGIEASPCFSYVKSKGLYAGVQFDGTILLTRSDENARFYNYPDIEIATILDNRLPWHQIPKACTPLWQALYAAEGRPDYMGTNEIPMEPSPGDHKWTEEELAQLQQPDATKHDPAIQPPPQRKVPLDKPMPQPDTSSAIGGPPPVPAHPSGAPAQEAPPSYESVATSNADTPLPPPRRTV